jgi:diguanylate cyclase (GGDEF)-like protein
MAAESIEQLFSILSDDYVQLFKLETCCLLLEDKDSSLQRLIPESTQAEHQQFLSLLNQPHDLQQFEHLTSTITTGVYEPQTHQWLLSTSSLQNIQSIAIMPLSRHGQKIGAFCCGSAERTRFKAHEACDFLQRLSYILSVCIENALNLERLKLSTLTDVLTQVHNRRFFDERLPEELSRRDRLLTAISCLFLDIDHFKSVNDTYGHGVGDDVLRQVAQRIQTALRTQDILARYGGEEFAVLLPDTDNEEALMVGQRIILEVNKNPIYISDTIVLTITLSAGLSTLESNNNSHNIIEVGSQLVSNADQALYKAKEQGRNRVINTGLLIIDEEERSYLHNHSF